MGAGTALMSGDLFVSGAIYEGDQALLSMYTTDHADKVGTSANTANTEYAVFDEDYYDSGTPFGSVITSKNCILTPSTGILSVTSTNHDKRFMELSFTLRLSSAQTAEAIIKVKDNGTLGSLMWQSGLLVVANNEIPFSATIIVQVGSNPTITVQGGLGQTLHTKSGSTLTYRNV